MAVLAAAAAAAATAAAAAAAAAQPPPQPLRNPPLNIVGQLAKLAQTCEREVILMRTSSKPHRLACSLIVILEHPPRTLSSDR